jgi:hypothetical protein
MNDREWLFRDGKAQNMEIQHVSSSSVEISQMILNPRPANSHGANVQRGRNRSQRSRAHASIFPAQRGLSQNVWNTPDTGDFVAPFAVG